MRVWCLEGISLWGTGSTHGVGPDGRCIMLVSCWIMSSVWDQCGLAPSEDAKWLSCLIFSWSQIFTRIQCTTFWSMITFHRIHIKDLFDWHQLFNPEAFIHYLTTAWYHVINAKTKIKHYLMRQNRIKTIKSVWGHMKVHCYTCQLYPPIANPHPKLKSLSRIFTSTKWCSEHAVKDLLYLVLR